MEGKREEREGMHLYTLYITEIVNIYNILYEFERDRFKHVGVECLKEGATCYFRLKVICMNKVSQ